MKVLLSGIVLTVVGVVCGPSAAAQEPSGLPRADAWVGIGWQRVTRPDEDTRSSYDNQRAIASAGGGLYWAPHLKIEFDAATPSQSSFRRVEPIEVDGLTGFRYSELVYHTTSFAAAQTWELFPNAWFTPYLGAGVEASKQRREEYVQSSYVVDPVTHATRQVEDPRELEPEHQTLVRPLAVVGFKAYMSRHAFFRSDARLTLGSGVEHVLIRIGFGADF